MEQRKLTWREESAVPVSIDQLLASRYSQLLHWGVVLTRGDKGKAEEIVQELCLYFTLTQPDLSQRRQSGWLPVHVAAPHLFVRPGACFARGAAFRQRSGVRFF